jgi:hypothetical protein
VKPPLHLVGPDETSAVGPSRIEHIRALQAEIRTLAHEHVMALSEAMGAARVLAAEIAAGGDAFAPGVRDLARRFAEDVDARAQTLEAIAGRS